MAEERMQTSSSDERTNHTITYQKENLANTGGTVNEHSMFDSRVNSYTHRPNIVPPYVLDALSQAHYKEQLNNTNVNVHKSTGTNEDEYLSFNNDPFVRQMKDNWHIFLRSVQNPNNYTPDQPAGDYDPGTKLEGSWEGEDRLKQALLGESKEEDDFLGRDNEGGFLGMLGLRRKPKKKTGSEEVVVRSRAGYGYWMSTEKRAVVLPTLKRIFLQNPLVPLFLRVLTIIFLATALGLACTIFVYSRRDYEGVTIEQQPSTIMAIVVQCCAIAYVTYIAYDEYSGKPLGLRDPWGKMRLIMLDLLFIIFSLGNLSLAFNTLFDDEWVCKANKNNVVMALVGIFYPTVASICRRQRALSSFLFLVLCLWVVTFLISIIRVVHRVSTNEHK